MFISLSVGEVERPSRAAAALSAASGVVGRRRRPAPGVFLLSRFSRHVVSLQSPRRSARPPRGSCSQSASMPVRRLGAHRHHVQRAVGPGRAGAPHAPVRSPRPELVRLGGGHHVGRPWWSRHVRSVWSPSMGSCRASTRKTHRASGSRSTRYEVTSCSQPCAHAPPAPSRSRSRAGPPGTARRPTRKKFTSRVRPGCAETRARFASPARAFSRLLLPTFDRPRNATSGSPSRGNCVRGGGAPGEDDRRASVGQAVA